MANLYNLYNKDCREVIPTLSGIDYVVTDPPYGINVNTDNSRFSGGTAGNMSKRGNGIGSANGKRIINDDKPFDPSFLVGIGKHQIIFGWNNFADKLPSGTCLVWIKRYDKAFGSFLSDAEVAWMSKGHGVYCKRDLSNNAIANDRVHPTQKPVSIMQWCIEMISNEGNTIFDPFMGSGTTGVAALQLGRKFIGCEIDPKYFAIAEKRIKSAALQPALFARSPTKRAPDKGNAAAQFDNFE